MRLLNRANLISSLIGIAKEYAVFSETTILSEITIALLSTPPFTDNLGHGTLMPTLPQSTAKGGPWPISTFYAGQKDVSRMVRGFIDFTVSQYQTPYEPVPARAGA
jgi:hypothetical protein